MTSCEQSRVGNEKSEYLDPEVVLGALFELGEEYREHVWSLMRKATELANLPQDGSEAEQAKRLRKSIGREASKYLPSLKELLGSELTMADFGYLELENSVQIHPRSVSATWRELIIAETQKSIGQP